VKYIAVAHGGDAWVDPAEPHGSRFAFTVRLGRKALEEAAVARKTESTA
jgi:signal transduction histidine kinase